MSGILYRCFNLLLIVKSADGTDPVQAVGHVTDRLVRAVPGGERLLTFLVNPHPHTLIVAGYCTFPVGVGVSGD